MKIPASPCERCGEGSKYRCAKCVDWRNWFQRSWRQVRKAFGAEE